MQLFAAPDVLAAERFIIAELGAVQGQLRMLDQSFGRSGLPETAKLKLVEIIQAAILKIETLTKKDWQFWITGAFASAVVILELDEAQRQEVLALIRLAFGGLFLKH